MSEKTQPTRPAGRISSVSCPFCKSQDIEGDSFDMEEWTVYQPVRCLACGKDWTDAYELNRRFVDPGEDGEIGYLQQDRPRVTVVINNVDEIQNAWADRDVDLHIIDPAYPIRGMHVTPTGQAEPPEEDLEAIGCRLNDTPAREDAASS